MTMMDVLETCRRVAGADAELEWVDGEFLIEQQVEPWIELPLGLDQRKATSCVRQLSGHSRTG